MTKLIALFFLLPLIALGEDLRLRDGTVYRRARVSEVAPDGLIVLYEKGMAKIAFEQLPKPLRERYGFDPGKAARFRAGEAKAARETAAENQRLIKEHEARVMENLRKSMEQNGEGFSFGGNKADAGVMRQVDGIISAQAAALVAAERVPATFWNAPFWQSPVVRLLGGILGGGGGGGGRGQAEPRGSFAGDNFGSLSFDPANH
jgi:hypothetical protein